MTVTFDRCQKWEADMALDTTRRISAHPLRWWLIEHAEDLIIVAALTTGRKAGKGTADLIERAANPDVDDEFIEREAEWLLQQLSPSAGAFLFDGRLARLGRRSPHFWNRCLLVEELRKKLTMLGLQCD